MGRSAGASHSQAIGIDGQSSTRLCLLSPTNYWISDEGKQTNTEFLLPSLEETDSHTAEHFLTSSIPYVCKNVDGDQLCMPSDYLFITFHLVMKIGNFRPTWAPIFTLPLQNPVQGPDKPL